MANLAYPGKLSTLFAALLILCCVSACSGMGDLRAHFRYVEEHLENNPDILLSDFEVGQGVLRVASRGSARKAVAIFLHGTPGAWTEAGRLFNNRELLDQVLLVSPDRPGWGGSANQPGRDKSGEKKQASFIAQSQSILPLIDALAAEYPGTPVYLLGHSWGASLAPYLAAQRRQTVEGLLLLAGAYSESLARPRWYHRLANSWPIKPVIGRSLRQANHEMLALPVGLAELRDQWTSLVSMPVFALQGGRDTLVDAENLTYLEAVLESERATGNKLHTFRDGDYGHLWHIQRSSLIADCLLALIDELPDNCERSLERLRQEE